MKSCHQSFPELLIIIVSNRDAGQLSGMKARIILLLIAFGLLNGSNGFGQDESAKARFMNDMTKAIYVKWPTSLVALDVAIVRNQELYNELQLASSSGLGLYTKNLNITLYDDPKQITKANLIYIHHKDFPNIQGLLDRFKNQDCLVVGENYPFRTSMINIIEQGDEAFYEINTDLIGSDNIKLKNTFLKRRANSAEQWSRMLAEAEAEIDEKETTIRTKDRTIAKKQREVHETKEKLNVTSDSLEQSQEDLVETSEKLVVTSDSLNLANLLVKQKEQRLEAERKLRIVFIVLLALAIAVVFFIFNSYRIKRKHAEKLARLNEKITKQNLLLEEKNREILDSIRYAERIQRALLPTDRFIKEHLQRSFVIFKPKDIVSGDFYWMERVGNKVLYAAVDCTGHGVPGAFVSVVGHDGLNRALREFHLTQPAQILDKLNELVDETFEKGEEEIKDGMDMALCAIDYDKNTLEYAGAQNPLWFIRKRENGPLMVNGEARDPVMEIDTHLLYEIKAEKQPIGKYADRHPFVNHTIALKKDDTFYTFSDGYADQFGGPKGKKFKYRPFKQLILEQQGKSMQEQKEIIESIFEAWKNETPDTTEGFEQIDDVVVFGVRV